MAKALATANAAADAATANEVTGQQVGDIVDNITPGQSAAVTDTSPVQGEVIPATSFKNEYYFPVYEKDGATIKTEILIQTR